jgi:hypothetical protein
MSHRTAEEGLDPMISRIPAERLLSVTCAMSVQTQVTQLAALIAYIHDNISNIYNISRVDNYSLQVSLWLAYLPSVPVFDPNCHH